MPKYHAPVSGQPIGWMRAGDQPKGTKSQRPLGNREQDKRIKELVARDRERRAA